MLIIKNKKGSLPDTISFVLKLAVTAAAFIIIGFFMLQLGEKTEGTVLNDTVTGQKAINFITNVGGDRMPSYFATLFVFDIIGIIATSFVITLSPIFFILYIIFIGIAIAFAVFGNNFYARMADSDILSSYIADQNFINFIMSHTTETALIVGAISAIIIMSKGTSSRGGADI
jgi:hypothetical protein